MCFIFLVVESGARGGRQRYKGGIAALPKSECNEAVASRFGGHVCLACTVKAVAGPPHSNLDGEGIGFVGVDV